MTSDSGASRVLPIPARVFVRPIASALPLGLFVFGVGMLLLGAQGIEWIAKPEGHQVGLLLASFVFPAEMLAGAFAFLARDAIAATVLSFYGVSWLALGLTQLSFSPQPTDTLGIYLIGFSIVVFGLAAVALVGKPLLAAVLTVSAIRALLQGVYEMSGSVTVQHAGGIAGLVLAALAFYAGLAFLFEDALGKRVLPTFRRGAAAAAVEGDLADQLRAATTDAGVREQL
jgi:succinate-acetate transporter protein